MPVQPKKSPGTPVNALVSALVAMAALAAFSPPAGAVPAVRKLADDVYMIADSGYASLAVVAADGVLITDPAFPRRARALKQAIAGITDQPVTRIVLSREHYGRVDGAGVFGDATVVCHVSQKAVFARDVCGGALRETGTSFDDPVIFDFGGKTVHLYRFGSADGFTSTVVHLPEQGIAYTADLYRTRGLMPAMWIEDVNYLDVLRVLKKMQKMNLRHAVNAYSDSTSARNIDENVEFIEDLFVLVSMEMHKALSVGGQPAVLERMEQWLQDVALPKYADWEGYREHLPTHVRRMARAIFHGG